MSEAALADDNTHGSQRVQRQRNLTPEQEVEAARKSLEAKDRTIAELRGTVSTVSEHGAKAASAASESALARIAEQESSLTSNITTAQTAENSAKAAKVAAREAGNLQAEMDADEALTNARVELRILTERKSNFDQSKERLTKEAKALANPPPAPAANTERRDQWFASHPRFHSDAQYKQDALDADALAKARGILPSNPDQYYNFLDAHLARIHGADHAGGGTQRRQETQHQDRDMSYSSSNAAPPNRESDGGGFTHQVDGSTLKLSRDQNGKPQLSGQIPAAWRESARWCGMEGVAYAIDQMKIAEERKAGVNQLVSSSDGMFYKV